jgi:hypothetical protein
MKRRRKRIRVRDKRTCTSILWSSSQVVVALTGTGRTAIGSRPLRGSRRARPSDSAPQRRVTSLI